MKEITCAASTEEWARASAFLEAELDGGGCPPADVMRLLVAAEEIFVNIAHYAYDQGVGGVLALRASVAGNTARVEFEDGGRAHNPLTRPDPDTTLSADERRVGGLGIFMARKLTTLSYRREGERNILTMEKSWA